MTFDDRKQFVMIAQCSPKGTRESILGPYHVLVKLRKFLRESHAVLQIQKVGGMGCVNSVSDLCVQLEFNGSRWCSDYNM